MGVAHYNRGSKVVSLQIERDFSSRKDSASAMTLNNNRLDRANERIAELTTLLGEQKASTDKVTRYMNLARAERDCLKQEVGDLRKQLEHTNTYSRNLAEIITSLDLRWRKCSAIIRAYVTPEEVQYMRDTDELWTKETPDA